MRIADERGIRHTRSTYGIENAYEAGNEKSVETSPGAGAGNACIEMRPADISDFCSYRNENAYEGGNETSARAIFAAGTIDARWLSVTSGDHGIRSSHD